MQELKLQKNYLSLAPVETIYIGGGTPSVLSSGELNLLLDCVFDQYNVIQNAEITLEANPDDLNQSRIKEFGNTSVNRLSIGIQSFFPEDLVYLNRVHSTKQAEYAIKASQDAGFQNLSIDLIYGIPTLSDAHWHENMMTAVSFEVPHISAYSLTVEPKTPLEIYIKKGKLENIDEAVQAHQFEMAINTMESKGYIHYEISNYCKEGFYSKHNSNYWKNKPYLGIGPSAHSYDLNKRQWNVSDIQKYIDSIETNKIPFDKENLSLITKYNEYILTRLRTVWGCKEQDILNEFGADFLVKFRASVLAHISNGNIVSKENAFILTQKGKLFANTVIADLFLDTESFA